ncbi:MAG: discoidin domain-containing protein, partial [Clostridia bacterium]|nr:discoidin domain-containing protein [Clostridia bacterium]
GTPKDSQVMTDNTSWLYDGDPTTVWVPYANRVTQTFLFDLGTAQKLTHLTINTAENTIIPEFRVEGSNDGQHWRIITNTYIRDAENPGAYNEPLSGTYRYVKILLLNAKNKEPNANPTYKLVEHEQTILCNPAKYSATEIADIIIYSDGEGEATLERFVESTLIVAK